MTITLTVLQSYKPTYKYSYFSIIWISPGKYQALHLGYSGELCWMQRNSRETLGARRKINRCTVSVARIWSSVLYC